MPPTLLAVCVGNSRTRIGAFRDGKLVDTRTLDNARPDELAPTAAELFNPIKDDERASVVLASVHPELCSRLEQELRELLGVKVYRVERDLPIPIGRHLDPETIVGEDRLLNAAAAYDTLKQACVIVDAGTAITIDFVDGAGTFHGGAIGPGARMMLEALHERTKQLPEVTLARPEEPIGHNTQQAMRSAVFHGLRGMVRELVEQYAEHVGSYPMVIATGGDSELLFADYELIERRVPDLTLLGIMVTVTSVVQEE